MKILSGYFLVQHARQQLSYKRGFIAHKLHFYSSLLPTLICTKSQIKQIVLKLIPMQIDIK